MSFLIYSIKIVVIQQRKKCFATIPDGKLPTNQKSEG
jgi:hypothetical protein